MHIKLSRNFQAIHKTLFAPLVRIAQFFSAVTVVSLADPRAVTKSIVQYANVQLKCVSVCVYTIMCTSFASILSVIVHIINALIHHTPLRSLSHSPLCANKQTILGNCTLAPSNGLSLEAEENREKKQQNNYIKLEDLEFCSLHHQLSTKHSKWSIYYIVQQQKGFC